MEERLVYININGKEYPMLLSTWATKQIMKRYGGLAEVGKTMENADYVEQLDATIWLITLLINAGIMFVNYKNARKDPLITQEMIEAVSSPKDFIGYKDAIFSAMNKGAERHIKSEEDLNQKNVEGA